MAPRARGCVCTLWNVCCLRFILCASLVVISNSLPKWARFGISALVSRVKQVSPGRDGAARRGGGRRPGTYRQRRGNAAYFPLCAATSLPLHSRFPVGSHLTDSTINEPNWNRNLLLLSRHNCTDRENYRFCTARWFVRRGWPAVGDGVPVRHVNNARLSPSSWGAWQLLCSMPDTCTTRPRSAPHGVHLYKYILCPPV